MIPIYLLLLLGAFIGFLVGLTGTGGGVLLTPMLIISGLGSLTAVGSDLIFNAIIKAIGSVMHYKKGNVNKNLLMPLLIGAIPTLFVGWLMLSWAKAHYSISSLNSDVSLVLSIILVITGLYMLFKIVINHRKKHAEKSKTPSKYVGAVAGGAVALSVEITSVGSGVAIMPYLLKAAKNTKEAVGTDLVYGFVVSLIAGLLHFSLGDVSPYVIVLLVVGALPTMVIGVLLASRTTRHDLLRLFIAVLVLISGIIVLNTVFGFFPV